VHRLRRIRHQLASERLQDDGPGHPDLIDATNQHLLQPDLGGLQADGIRILNQTGVRILGPGIVQKFRRHGIFVVGTIGVSTRATVKQVTSHHNCFSGLLMAGVSDSLVEGVVSVKNANNSGTAPCGGNCIVNSHNNRIRHNEFSGNGSGDSGATTSASACWPAAATGREEWHRRQHQRDPFRRTPGNVIRRNIIAGNPPGQVSRAFGASAGFDIRDDSAAAGSGTRNTVADNLCVTYSGPGPAPCPTTPRIAVDHNTSRKHHHDDEDEDDEDEHR
jgi:hypothetical protein